MTLFSDITLCTYDDIIHDKGTSRYAFSFHTSIIWVDLYIMNISTH